MQMTNDAASFTEPNLFNLTFIIVEAVLLIVKTVLRKV